MATKKLKIKVPESWEAVTLKQYLEFVKNDEPTVEHAIRAFLGFSIEDVRALGVNNVELISQSLSKVLKQDTNSFPLISKITLNGKRYGLIPNFDDMSYGEYLDLSQYLKDNNSLPQAMAVLYRPIVEERKDGKYLIEEYTGKEDKRIMLDMPMSAVFSVLGFFFRLSKILLAYIPTYMEGLLKEELDSSKVSQADGERTREYMNLLKETLRNMTKLQPFPYTSA